MSESSSVIISDNVDKKLRNLNFIQSCVCHNGFSGLVRHLLKNEFQRETALFSITENQYKYNKSKIKRNILS